MGNRTKFLLFFLLFAFFVTPSSVVAATYYVSPSGSDTNIGTETQPWKTIQKAAATVVAGDTIYIRGGTYPVIWKGWNFTNSGTSSAPITVRNYEGEQVLISLNNPVQEYSAFRCWYTSSPETSKADYIKVIGSDAGSRTLSNSVTTEKGIVIQGFRVGSIGNGSGFETAGCDNWEIAGIDFVDVPYAIFTKNYTSGSLTDYKSDNYYVHDNRVHGFYNESAMQFNGNGNRIENNVISKITNINDTPQWGCQPLNLLGNGNIVKGNTFNLGGSTVTCVGLVFEWDMSDSNIIEQNTFNNFSQGISISGGDNNIIRNNIIYRSSTPIEYNGGLNIYANNNYTGWPCNETVEAPMIVPANNPSAPNYANYYNPRSCLSYGNQIYNNVIHGYEISIKIYPQTASGTVIRNNALSGWTHGGICFYDATTGGCKTLTSDVTESNNATSGNFNFVNIGSYNFHLTSSSSLINVGYNLSSLVPDDKDGVSRPQGSEYDIGAYEYTGASPSTPPSPSAPTGKAGDANGDNKVDGVDYVIWLSHYNQSVFGSANGDFNTSGKVDGVDYVVWANNYGK